MIRKAILLPTLLLAATTLFAQGSNRSEFLVMEQVKRNLNDENWAGAAYAADKILSGNENHTEFNYYAGIGNINSKNYQLGFQQMMIAAADKEAKLKDIDFWKGRAFMGVEMPDSALVYLRKYKEAKGKVPMHTSGYGVDYFISQCENAQRLIAAPVKAVVTNMGERINDEGDDATPSLNTEGSLLVFSSRRNSNIGGKDDPNDGKPFQDVWISRLDTATGKWGEAENLTKLNSDGHEGVMSISPDGNTVFIYKNTGANTGSGDIWFARTKGDPLDWNRPREFEGEFNSSYFETSACLAPGGKTMFFISERPDGKASGNGDVWMCERLNRREWKKPVNLGQNVNSAYDEVSVTVHPNGKTIFFASNSDKSMGGYDIFKTELVDGKWTDPVNLGYPINTMGDELHFNLSADGKKAYIASNRPGGLGLYDLYEIDLANYELSIDNGEAGRKLISSENVLSVLKGKIIDQSTGTSNGTEATIVVVDVETGAEVAKTDSDENGNYFLTLPGGKKYKVTVRAETFKTQEDEFYLGKRASGQPYTLSKSYYLEKQ